MKKIVCFGLGGMYKTFLQTYDTSKAEIVALSDNNDSQRNDYGAVSPNEIKNIDFDFIVITCAGYREIKEQLCGYGIEESCILNFNDIYTHLATGSSYPLLDILISNLPLTLGYESFVKKLNDNQEKMLFLSAKNFVNTVKCKKIAALEEVEFQVFSQFGEDGIIQWLIHNVDIENKTFIEFGVEDYTESNTRFLLMNNNWSGFVMDGSTTNMNRLKDWECLWKYDLMFTAAFITKDNINQLISEAGFCGDIGILSIDLDGNDWWILNAVTCVSPRILICEYNNIFGAEKKVTVPYDAEFVRTKKHYSNLYWGCSISALCIWAETNGYYYMGSNSAGNNAFFVRKDCIGEDMIPPKANMFVESKYRESRDEKGNLTYLKGIERLKCIKEMEIFDIETGYTDTIENVYNFTAVL